MAGLTSEKIVVLGAGSWGTALAVHLALKGLEVSLWARREEQARQLREEGENKRYLPGVTIPPAVEITSDLERALARAGAAVFAVPSHAFESVLQTVLPYLPPGTWIVNTAKGLQEDSLLRLSQVAVAIAGEEILDRYVALSGPSHAEEVGRQLPTAVVAAGRERPAVVVQDLFMAQAFRVYTNPDLLGVELAGALKNIIALGSGIALGLGFGDNTLAALMTRGLAEITRLGVALGANPLTFAGLAGVGDLVVTCTSRHSRNRRAGELIGSGFTLTEAVTRVGMVVEGVRTTRAAYRLAQKTGIEMPIVEQMYQVLFANLPPRQAVENLMTRGKKGEVEEVARARVRVVPEWGNEAEREGKR